MISSKQVDVLNRLNKAYMTGGSRKKAIDKLFNKKINKKNMSFKEFYNMNIKNGGGSYWPTAPRDTRAITSGTHYLWDVPRHLSGVAINLADTVYQTGKLAVKGYELSTEFAGITDRPNEPIPKGTFGDGFNKYIKQ